jgi:hypothetical protein
MLPPQPGHGVTNLCNHDDRPQLGQEHIRTRFVTHPTIQLLPEVGIPIQYTAFEQRSRPSRDGAGVARVTQSGWPHVRQRPPLHVSSQLGLAMAALPFEREVIDLFR